ncbi:zinc finger and BTB domain-containing protein 24 [Brachionichthys hirsutus]|uniref:zinc finger and BTB domain-containing protein 24 n=1 Tax=Brachionichthys hirsutus TaxID=412623 RepID=UPI003604D86D
MTSTARTSSLVALHSDSHKQSILSKFNKLRQRELLCDITLVVENVHFKAHKALLAASSDYFSFMFTAGDRTGQPTYTIDGIAAKMFAAVLEFIYSAQVLVEASAAEQLLATARLVQVGDLVKALGELARRTATTGGEEVNANTAEGPDPSRRKRGRPKKNAAATQPEGRSGPHGSSEEVQEEEEEEVAAAAAARPKDDAGAHRHSKRKIRPPVKYRSYKVGTDSAQGKELGNKGRKRKYPNTEARCEDCSKVFQNQLLLRIHQRTHTGEKPFQCSVCGKAFTQKHALLAHQRIHTGEKPFVCSVCSKALSSKHTLQEHMNLHEEKKSFRCEKCGKTFSQKRQLKSHSRVHTGKSLPECAQCHHKFMDTAQLKKHLRTHTGEKPFTCEICGKCYTTKSTLQTHIRIHRGEKPYGCSICNKSFSDPSARRRHVTSHSGMRPFACSVCSLSFTRLDSLKTHGKSHNKERAAPAQAPQQEEEEEEPSIQQLQQYQLPSSSEQEIQLVVTGDDINFVPSQEQQFSIITTVGETAESRLTLLTRSSGNMQNMALVAQGGTADRNPQIQAISMLEGQQPEQMHVITLSKEALEQLQAHHSPPQPLQVMQPPGVAQENRDKRSQTSEQISSHHIQGQTFQIQAGTVSYLYTTGLHQES